MKKKQIKSSFSMNCQKGATLLEAIVAAGLFSIITLVSLNTQSTVTKHKNQLRDKFNSARIVNEIYRQLQDKNNCECNFINSTTPLILNSVDNSGNPYFSYKLNDGDPYDAIRLFTGGDCNTANSLSLVHISPTANSVYNDTRGALTVDDIIVKKIQGATPLDYQIELIINFYNQRFEQNSGQSITGLKFLERRFKLNVNIDNDNQVTSCFNRDTAMYKTIKMRLCPEDDITYDDTHFTGDETELLLSDRYKCNRDSLKFEQTPSTSQSVSTCFSKNGKLGYLTLIKDEPSATSPNGNGEYTYSCVEQRDINIVEGFAMPGCDEDERLTGFTELGAPVCRKITKLDIKHLYESHSRASAPSPLSSTSLGFGGAVNPVKKFRIITQDEVSP